MDKMKKKQIDFMLCKIKRDYTKKMELEFIKHYNNKNGERETEMKTIDLFDASKVESRHFHFIFVLDESGSMSQDWYDLVKAYNYFMETRKNNQSLEDYIFIVPFDSKPRIECELVPLSAAPTTIFRGGGMKFTAALTHASVIIGKTPSNCVPVTIFMSDGGDSGRDSLQAMQQLKNAHNSKGFIVHTIAFGASAVTGLLSQLAAPFLYD
jgi:uncharacterized protein YegL